MTNIGILHEAGHPEPWIIAMDCPPTRAAVLDYGSRWAIEPAFSDFKDRGFQLEDLQREHADRLERLMLIMALAMHWCVRMGQDDALQRPTPLEKNGVLVHPGLRYLKGVCKIISPCQVSRSYCETDR